MKKALSVQQIQRLDKDAIERYGLPSLVLMENAGRGVAAAVIQKLKKKAATVCVFCGLGNNAGDGLVAARHLIDAGIKTKIFLIGRGDQLREDAAVYYRVLKRLKHPVKENVCLTPALVEEVVKADMVVDALFGVGLNREIEEPFAGIIQCVNDKAGYILAVDIPSGLDGTTGRIYGTCVRADMTVTFSFPKQGFYKNEGPKVTGKVLVVDIGIPEKLMRVYGRLGKQY